MAILPQQPVPVKIGRYRILKPLGKGGMGSVYLAQDTELDRQVALKIPHISEQDSSSVLERFYREARAAATLRHPHICPLFDIGEHQGTPYLTMAYIEGKSLGEFARSKPLTHRSTAILVRKLALALQEAHQRGIIHRDLKPANIMIDKRGEPIVMDFGLARRLSRDDTRLTQTGAAIGTPAYMPPEQISANAELMGPACDIYSLGVILYELLTGRLPFEGDAMAMLAQILTDEPRRPSELQPNIDPALEAICLKAMAKKPADRFGSMVEMAARLMDYLKGKTPEPPALATVVPVAAETKPSGIHLSLLGGLRSMAQAGMQMRPPKAAVEGPPLKRKRKKQKLPAWVWASIGGGAVAVLISIIAIIWSLSGPATVKVIPTAPEAAAFVPQEKPRESQDSKEAIQRIEPPESVRAEPDATPPSTPPTPIVGAKSVPEAPSTKPIEPERSPKLITPNKSPEPQWTSLFNGRNLNGWKTHPNDKAKWEVRNGILIGSAGRGLLFTERNDYEDIQFRVEARVSATGNSGQFFRTKFGPSTPTKGYDGYEAQIYAGQADQRTGSLYNFVKISQQLHQPSQWFTQEVIAQGNHIVILVNNEKVVDFQDPANTFRRGHLALQQNNPSGTIEFRKVEVKELESSRSVGMDGSGAEAPSQKLIEPERSPKPIAVPQVVQHKTFSWDKSKTNYARYDDRVFDVGLGNETPGWGTGAAGVELENVRHLKLSATFSGKFKYMDVNSLAGFLIDYGTAAGYTKRVSLHTGVCDRKRFATWPNWGKGKVPDDYVSIGSQKVHDIHFQTWAPPDWDGRVWFSVIISNSGDRTRIVARITDME